MSRGNLFEQIPANLSEEAFDTLAQSRHASVERIVSNGQSSPESGWYDQEYDEWVIVLKGSATIVFENGTVVDLAEGDYLNIPAHQKHRVARTSSKPKTIWLAVHY